MFKALVRSVSSTRLSPSTPLLGASLTALNELSLKPNIISMTSQIISKPYAAYL